MFKRCGKGVDHLKKIVLTCRRMMISCFLSSILVGAAEHVHAAEHPSHKVLVIGGSMAYGYRDPHNHSYIQRAFERLADAQHAELVYVNHAKPGGTSVALARRGRTFEQWLKSAEPDTVVISWGLENDCKKHTNLQAFERTVQREIQAALDSRASVVVISPPVTEANATYFFADTNRYLAAEQKLVSTYKGQPVYFCDVLNQMRSNLAERGKTVQPYEGDGWHPNTAGHILAGKLLYADLKNIPLWDANRS